MEKVTKIDLGFMREDTKELKIVKRRTPLRHAFFDDEEAEDYISSLNSFNYFAKNFETRFEIKKGEVFLAKLGYGAGCEIAGNHYVVAILNSKPINQSVTVIPLKSKKDKKPLNPASDILIGTIEGLNSNETIAVINQVRTIDKARLLNSETLMNARRYIADSMIAENKEITVNHNTVFRLNDEQLKRVSKAIQQFVYNGYIRQA